MTKKENWQTFWEEFPPQDDETLIDAALSVPFSQISNMFDFKNNYSPDTFKKRFKTLLKQYQSYFRVNRTVQKPRDEIPWDIEEDYWLYIYITKKDQLTEQEIQNNRLNHINPIRTQQEILNRIEKIKYYTPEQINTLLNEMTSRITTEKMIYLTLTPDSKHLAASQYRCVSRKEQKYPFTRTDELSELENFLPMTETTYFDGSELAILLSETAYYKITTVTVTIGYRRYIAELNIDLSLICDHDCSHISHNQAIITFLEDYRFYIENIGTQVFRVNGVIVPPNKCAHLPNYAILDFCDLLFMFIINKNKISEIEQTYNKIHQKSKNQKSHNKAQIQQVQSDEDQTSNIYTENDINVCSFVDEHGFDIQHLL